MRTATPAIFALLALTFGPPRVARADEGVGFAELRDQLVRQQELLDRQEAELARQTADRRPGRGAGATT